ncbi:MFS transporter [Spelaeicoccus albus]|uniref:Inositol transporter-like SP family MFS transporter n=1 Tax=Spelaeicoccus albus TaxID=1280376 RepID=A0A7Z0D1T3_9MICO|nr:MFS transporter [Spelaeicoccus albus]NYI66775.1 inositol transporter-like SP family MFS transporter [Spelaeicoccus albus]
MALASDGNAFETITTATPPHWRWTFVAAMAGFIDAGSIVAGSVGLNIWVPHFGLTNSMVGLLGAISSNAISAGVGALLGGWICDKYGRKKIYAYDLVLYMFGLLFLIFTMAPWMLFVGYIIVGLAVGADIPASWSLITEFAPARRRGRLGSLVQVLWNLGPVVMLSLGLLLQPLGMLGIRFIFGFLFVVGLVTWIMRHGVGESERWQRANDAKNLTGDLTKPARSFGRDIKALLTKPALGMFVMLIGMYGLWNIFAGTNGFYQPYLLKSIGNETNAASVGLQCMYFGATVLTTVFVFGWLIDKINRRFLFGLSAAVQIAGMSLLIFFPLTTPIAFAYLLSTGLAIGFGQQAFFQLWSGEVFPTRLRGTAQGLIFAIVRIALGFWSFFVPIVTATGFRPLAIILTAVLLASGIIGFVWAPSTSGKTLEEIEHDRYGAKENAHV